MQHRLRLPVAIVAGATVLALALPATASAGRAAHRPGANVVASSSIVNTSTKRHPFKIKAGRIYDVVVKSLSGVRRGDRLALEAHYRSRLAHPKRWHVIGKWKLHRGEHHFRGAARATIPGLWTLRVQFIRHHRKLRGSQSNRFYVKVKRFRHDRIRRTPKNGHGTSNVTQLTGWNDIQCAYPRSLGHGISVTSPDSNTYTFTPNVDIVVVAWIRDEIPGQSFGDWHPYYQEQALGGGRVAIGREGTDPTHIQPVDVEYGGPLGDGEQTDLYHQIVWDIAVVHSDGSLHWYYQDSYEPNNVEQYGRGGAVPSQQSASCITWQSPQG